MKKDADRLRAFLDLLPADRRFVIEFRHASWFEDDIFEALRARDVAMCVAAQPWTEAYVYFKHDEGVGSGPPAVDVFVAAVKAQA